MFCGDVFGAVPFCFCGHPVSHTVSSWRNFLFVFLLNKISLSFYFKLNSFSFWLRNFLSFIRKFPFTWFTLKLRTFPSVFITVFSNSEWRNWIKIFIGSRVCINVNKIMCVSFFADGVCFFLDHQYQNHINHAVSELWWYGDLCLFIIVFVSCVAISTICTLEVWQRKEWVINGCNYDEEIKIEKNLLSYKHLKLDLLSQMPKKNNGK